MVMEVITMIKNYKVEGMTCMHCVHHVKSALEEVSGVKDVKVSLDAHSAMIVSDSEIEFKVLKGAVEEAGYKLIEA